MDDSNAPGDMAPEPDVSITPKAEPKPKDDPQNEHEDVADSSEPVPEPEILDRNA